MTSQLPAASFRDLRSQSQPSFRNGAQLQAAIDEGRVRLIPKATGETGRFVEVEGSPDLVIEIVSDSSVNKDTWRLPKAYFDAGLSELLAQGFIGTEEEVREDYWFRDEVTRSVAYGTIP